MMFSPRRLVEKYADMVASLYSAALVYRDPRGDVSLAASAAGAVGGLGVLAALFLGALWLAGAAVAAAVAVLFAPLIYGWSEARRHREKLEAEAVFTAAAAASLAHAANPVSLAENICDMGELESSKEFCEIKRQITVLGKVPLEAYEDRVRNTPSLQFKSILTTIIHHMIIGTGLRDALIRQIPDMLRERVQKYSQSIEKISTILIAYVLSNMMLPIVFLMISFLEISSSVNVSTYVPQTLLTILFFAISGTIGVGLAFVKHRATIPLPRSENAAKIGIPAAVLLSLAAGFAFSAQPSVAELYTLAAVLVAIFSAVSAVLYILWKRERGIIYSLQAGIMTFARDLAEYKRLGYTLQDALMRLSESDYGRFSEILRRIKTLVLTGSSMPDAIRAVMRHISDWTTRTIMSLLAKVSEKGDAPVEALISLSNFIHNTITVERMARIEYRLYQLLAIFSMPLVLAILYITVGMVLPLTMTLTLMPELVAERLLYSLSVSLVLIVGQAWLLGVVAGKFTETHVGATMKYAVGSMILSVVLFFVGFITVVLPVIP